MKSITDIIPTGSIIPVCTVNDPGMAVPLAFEEVAQRWRSRSVLAELSRQVEQNEVKLPPRRLDKGAEGVRVDLESLGVLQRLLDNRVNIRDVYRVGYGLGRMGGVKPSR